MPKEYQLIEQMPGVEMRTVKRISDGAFIPFDPANRDYQEYLDWISLGNNPDPPDVPQTVKLPELPPGETTLSPEDELKLKEQPP